MHAAEHALAILVGAALAGHKPARVGVPARQVGVAATGYIERSRHVFALQRKRPEYGGRLEAQYVHALGRQVAGVYEAVGQVHLGSLPEPEDVVFGVAAGPRKAQVQQATVILDRCAGSTRRKINIVTTAIAKSVAVVEHPGGHREAVVKCGAVKSEPGVMQGRKDARKRTLHEGDVLRTGKRLEAEGLLEVADPDSAQTRDALYAQVYVLEVGVASGEVVLGFKDYIAVYGARHVEPRAAEFARAGLFAYGCFYGAVGVPGHGVGHDPTTDLEREITVARQHTDAVFPAEVKLGVGGGGARSRHHHQCGEGQWCAVRSHFFSLCFCDDRF